MRNATDYRIPSDALVEESLQLLPQAWHMNSVRAFKHFLVGALPQNAETTRLIAADVICGRFFAGDRIDRELLAMVNAAASRIEKRDLIAYRFMIAERLVGDFVADVLFEKLTGEDSQVTQDEVNRFIVQRLGRESAKGCARISGILVKFGHLDRVSRNGHTYGIRRLEPDFCTLAYACHCEFPIPSMYRMSDLANSRFRRLFLLSSAAFLSFVKQASSRGLVDHIQSGGLEQVRIQLTVSELVSRLTGVGIDALR